MKSDELIEDYCFDATDNQTKAVYPKADVDAAIAELKSENERLNRELEHVKNGDCINTCDVVEKHVKEEIKAKRALWLARAKNASYNVKDRQRIINRELDQERPDIEFIHHHEKVKQKWMNVKSICKKKAEEYK